MEKSPSRLSIYMSKELRKKYKLQAVKEGKSLKELVLEALDRNYK